MPRYRTKDVEVVWVYLTPAIKGHIDSLAKSLGMSRSSAIRLALLATDKVTIAKGLMIMAESREKIS